MAETADSGDSRVQVLVSSITKSQVTLGPPDVQDQMVTPVWVSARDNRMEPDTRDNQR